MLIAVYNTQWQASLGQAVRDRPGSCKFTRDRNALPDADAVVFHVPTLRDLPRHKPPGQVWVAWSMESRIFYPELQDPDFMRRFDITMTYRLDSDVPTPYLVSEYLSRLRTPVQGKAADAPVACFLSSRFDESGRYRYVKELMKHIPVHSYGRQLRNRRVPDAGHQTKLEILSHYKFNLAFENCVDTDYVTEKLYDPLIAGCVPVYLGAPNVARFAPDGKCLIDAAGFPEPAELAEYLKRLDCDENLYREYLEWKRKPYTADFQNLVALAGTTPSYRLCQKLSDMRRRSVGPLQTTPHSPVSFWSIPRPGGRAVARVKLKMRLWSRGRSR